MTHPLLSARTRQDAIAATTVKDRDGYEFEAEESVLSTLPAHHGVLPLLHVYTGATQPLQKFVKHVLPFNLHKCVLGGLAIVVKVCATDGSGLVFVFLLIGTWLCLAFVDRLCGPAVCQVSCIAGGGVAAVVSRAGRAAGTCVNLVVHWCGC